MWHKLDAHVNGEYALNAIKTERERQKGLKKRQIRAKKSKENAEGTAPPRPDSLAPMPPDPSGQ